MTITRTQRYTDGCKSYRVTDARYGGTFWFTTDSKGCVRSATPPNDGWLYLVDRSLDDSPQFSTLHLHDGFNTSEVVLSEGWR